MVTVEPFFAGILKELLPDFAEYVFVAPPDTDTTIGAALHVVTFLPLTDLVVQVFANDDGTVTAILAVEPFNTAVALTVGTTTAGADCVADDGALGDAAGAAATGAAVGAIAAGLRFVGVSGTTLGSSGNATKPLTRT